MNYNRAVKGCQLTFSTCTRDSINHGCNDDKRVSAHHLWDELLDVLRTKETHTRDDFALEDVDGPDYSIFAVCLNMMSQSILTRGRDM